MRFDGKRTELEPLAVDHNGLIDCHNGSVDRYIKVKIGNILLYGLVKVSAIPFWSHDDRFYHYIGVNSTFAMLDCDRYIGDICIPWIVKPGFHSIHYTVTGLKMLTVISGISFYRRLLYQGSTVFPALMADIHIGFLAGYTSNNKIHIAAIYVFVGLPLQYSEGFFPVKQNRKKETSQL